MGSSQSSGRRQQHKTITTTTTAKSNKKYLKRQQHKAAINNQYEQDSIYSNNNFSLPNDRAHHHHHHVPLTNSVGAGIVNATNHYHHHPYATASGLNESIGNYCHVLPCCEAAVMAAATANARRPEYYVPANGDSHEWLDDSPQDVPMPMPMPMRASGSLMQLSRLQHAVSDDLGLFEASPQYSSNYLSGGNYTHQGYHHQPKVQRRSQQQQQLRYSSSNQLDYLANNSNIATIAGHKNPKANKTRRIRRQGISNNNTYHQIQAHPSSSSSSGSALAKKAQQQSSSAYSSRLLTTIGSGTSINHIEASESNYYYRDHFHQMYIQSRLQRGLAYSYDERKQHGLLGLLPPAIQDQDTQIRGVINFLDNCKDELSKYIYLRQLKDFNEKLFYSTVMKNVEKLMPIVYTPTVGLGCQKFSEIYSRPRGLFISINELGLIDTVLANWHEKDVRVIVVTDGERILGLGDLGANGMGISIGKLSLYTALAGIPPQNVLPITIDVGTNNQQLLADPFYIGLKQERIRGDRYYELIDEFMKAISDRWGRSCLIQFEDFGNSTAFNLLKRYRDHYCTFNDDIQGTASVCVSGLISASKQIEKRLSDCSFLFYGAGEANLGTANLLSMAMVEEGTSLDEAKKSIWLVDSKGLVVRSRNDLSSHKLTYAQDVPAIKGLIDIIDYVKPTAIIGASAQGGAFDESICRKMSKYNNRPIIFALSNPTSKAECTADQAYRWTEGRCVFASGSPFEPVEYGGRTFITGQGNNAYIFPGVGLAAIAAHVYNIPEETFLVAARALSDQLTSGDTSVGLVYPRLNKIREVTLQVAIRVLEFFYAERLATYRPEPDDKMGFLLGIQYDSRYESDSLN